MCQLSNGVAQEEKLLSEFEALDALVRPIVAEEVEPLWAPVGRNPLDASVEGTYASEVERMKKWIPDRVRAVRTLIEAEGVACPEGCEEGARVACEASGREGHRVCTSARWGACSSPDPVGGAGGESGAGGATNTGVDSGGSDGGGSPGVAGETGITSAGSPGNGGSAIESGGQSGASAGGAGPGGATGEAGNDNVNPGAPRKESGGCVLGRRADSADEAGAWLLLFAMSLRSTRRKRRVEEVHRRSSW
jgi:hypothetical protein